MRKRILALLLALAMSLGVATVAMADSSNANTDGSIKFKDGDVIIIPPPDPDGDCCDCYGKAPENDCECPCHDPDEYADPNDLPGFKNFDYGGNLYFGEWTIGDYRTYDSTVDGGSIGTHTGIQVINQTSGTAKVGVEITAFIFDDQDSHELEGAELTLFEYELAVGYGYVNGDVDQKNDVALNDQPILILTVPAGARAKASWSGELEVQPGTAIYEGTAKATLTWSDLTNTP